MQYSKVTLGEQAQSLDLRNDVVKPFTSPDNLAIDADGNMYIVEDQDGGKQDTWFAKDKDHDGVAEAVGKWASLTTIEAEATGLYFDPFKSNTAYINVQHPDSAVDRTFMITTPCQKTKGDNGHDKD